MDLFLAARSLPRPLAPAERRRRTFCCRRGIAILPVLFCVLMAGSACDLFNPCISLAERICACERTPSARENCRQIRIEALRNNVDITEDQLNVCQEKLETCDCDDIDENRVDECGYVVE